MRLGFQPLHLVLRVLAGAIRAKWNAQGVFFGAPPCKAQPLTPPSCREPPAESPARIEPLFGWNCACDLNARSVAAEQNNVIETASQDFPRLLDLDISFFILLVTEIRQDTRLVLTLTAFLDQLHTAAIAAAAACCCYTETCCSCATRSRRAVSDADLIPT